MRFAFVNVNVIYIHEEELGLEFQELIDQVVQSEAPLFVVLQIKLAKIEFQPLINNLMEIRKGKARKKLEDWLEEKSFNSKDIRTYIKAKSIKFKDVDFDFKDTGLVNYYYQNKAGKEVLTILKNHYKIEAVQEHLLSTTH